jgi:dihydrofolate reductase
LPPVPVLEWEAAAHDHSPPGKEINMGKILVHEFISLDGVNEDPSWTMGYAFDPKMGEAIGAIMGSCEGLLLGRKTYEMFAPAWSGRTAEQDPGAPFMNESPKYVVSSTLASGDWNNTTIVGPYDKGAIQALKDGLEGSLYVSGSTTLVRAMLGDGLVDEVHLFVYPMSLGAGRRLFAEDQTNKFTLLQAEPYSSGVLHLAYEATV